MNLEQLLQRSDLWRGSSRAFSDNKDHPAVSSGHAELDRELPGGGWPLGALTELLLEQHGIGELQLLMPALARLTREGRWLAWITPPYLPYAPALAASGVDLARFLYIDSADPKAVLWAMEQTLRSGVCGAVLGWPKTVEPKALRRLQLAAESGGAMGVLFRPLQAAQQASPAALRLQLASADREGSENGLDIHILKRRGGWSNQPLYLQRHAVA